MQHTRLRLHGLSLVFLHLDPSASKATGLPALPAAIACVRWWLHRPLPSCLLTLFEDANDWQQRTLVFFFKKNVMCSDVKQKHVAEIKQWATNICTGKCGSDAIQGLAISAYYMSITSAYILRRKRGRPPIHIRTEMLHYRMLCMVQRRAKKTS